MITRCDKTLELIPIDRAEGCVIGAARSCDRYSKVTPAVAWSLYVLAVDAVYVGPRAVS
jgi:hypothetical protein